jgi:hypothetical protein
VPDISPAPGWPVAGPALCVIVLLAMLIAVLYAAWICLDNYSRIGV